MGVTLEGRRHKALTLGFEYERHLSSKASIGVVVERALGDLDFTVVALPLAWHRGPWKVSLGPGIEIPDGDEDDEFLVRAAAAYVFERKSIEYVPTFAVDIVDGEAAFVLSVVIGKGF